jgi:hypothetical protein
MPVPGIWGPLLWKVLHPLSIVQSTRNSFQKDKEYQYKWLIEHLETIIPCEECRKHSKEYRQSHPGYMTNPKEWMWTFHNAVNTRLGKEEFPLDQLLESTSIRKSWKEYTDSLQESLLTGHLRGELVKEYKRHLLLWAAFSGL